MAEGTNETARKPPAAATFLAAARRTMQRCGELALCTERDGEITRRFCTPAMRAAHDLLREWMAAARLTTTLDSAGNLIGRWTSRGRQAFNAKALWIGSHLDSVVNAGKYDGVLGVAMSLALSEILNEADTALPFDLSVVAFSEEEGVRFQTPYIGSLAVAGAFPSELMLRRDADGRTLGEVLDGFCGASDPHRAAIDPADVLGFVEPHIEQGPILELENLPIGVVTGIAGQTRAGIRLTGKSGHAGTIPMTARRDALAATSECILEVERIARRHLGMVATVGHIDVSPNVRNVVPGAATIQLDLRHADDAIRLSAFQEIGQRFIEICGERGVACQIDWVEQQPAVHSDAAFVTRLERALVQSGCRAVRMTSGAGHDAAVMARRFPTGMIFVRCKAGLSHHPDESVSEADVAVALEVLWRFIADLSNMA